MPPKFKDFGAPVKPGAAIDEPIVFRLYDEMFKCRAVVQGRVLIRLLTLANQVNTADAAVAIMDFFDHVLIDDDKKRFVDMCESEDKIVPIELMTEIMEFLVESYGNIEAVEGGASEVERPTKPSSDSSPGPEDTGLPLMEGQYAPVAVSST